MALAVARYMVVFLKRPGGQAQFSAALALQAADDKFGALHDWVDNYLGDDLSLSVLADQAGMSERSFQPPLCGGHGANAGPRHRAAAGGGGAASAFGVAHAGQANRAALRLRLGETMRRSFLRCSPSRRKITVLTSRFEIRLP
jgi:hypothetical protein